MLLLFKNTLFKNYNNKTVQINCDHCAKRGLHSPEGNCSRTIALLGNGTFYSPSRDHY
jgi:hypothetical protein